MSTSLNKQGLENIASSPVCDEIQKSDVNNLFVFNSFHCETE